MVKRWHVISKLVGERGWEVGVEIGVKEGENLFYIMEHCPELKMTGVDPWIHQPWQNGKPHGETYVTWDVESMYSKVKEKAKEYNGRCDIVRAMSVDAAELFADNSLDFVFIDAQHTSEGVSSDIRTWEPKVKEGGWVMGHDLQFGSVRAAVTNAYPDYKELPNYVWYHQK